MDSAIAALICTTVIHPQSMGLGGGVIFTIYNASTGRYQPLMQFEVLLMPKNTCHYFNVMKLKTTHNHTVCSSLYIFFSAGEVEVINARETVPSRSPPNLTEQCFKPGFVKPGKYYHFLKKYKKGF